MKNWSLSRQHSAIEFSLKRGLHKLYIGTYLHHFHRFYLMTTVKMFGVSIKMFKTISTKPSQTKKSARIRQINVNNMCTVCALAHLHKLIIYFATKISFKSHI